MALDALTGVLPQEAGRWPQFPYWGKFASANPFRMGNPEECEGRSGEPHCTSWGKPPNER